MSRVKRSTRWTARLLALTTAVSLVLPAGVHASAATAYSRDEFEQIVSQYAVSKTAVGYEDYICQYPQTRPDTVIEVDAADFVRYAEGEKEAAPQIFADYQGMSGDSVLTTENSLIEFEVTVEKDGYYDLSFLYYPVAGKNSAIQRSIFLDGALPYDELSLVEFQRVWTVDMLQTRINADGVEVRNWVKDNQGNDLKPGSVEIPEWIESYVYDSEGFITTQMALYLTRGDHTITLTGLREPMLMRKLILSNRSSAVSYAEKKAAWDAMGAKDTSGQMIRIEAENAVKTSSQMLYAQQDQSSPAVYPSSAKELLNNTIGGNSWRLNGQWIEWEFDVPETGYYNIALFAKQNFVKGIYVSRRISIDGAIPFEQMEDYGFSYASGWRTDVLSDGSDPYRFYLEAGTHTIRMEVVLGEFADIISDVRDCVTQLNAIYRSVIRITGVAPDQYRDYQIERNLPELAGQLTKVRQELDTAITNLRALIGENSDKESVLITMRDQLDELIYDQERFTEVMASYKVNVRATANWITQVIDQPLQLDRLYVFSPDVQIKVGKTGFWAGLWHEICRLFYSFIIDYNQIGNITTDEDATAITLWIGTGRDQANVIKSMIDATFTPVSGINVNVQLVDMNTLLRATLAGQGPDVAIQVPNTNGIAGAVLSSGNDSAVNYGIRNAVVDLRQFPDYDEVITRFSDSAMVQLQFNGSTYGLPETQTFPMMFYRKDILAELNLAIPQTWSDVKVAMTVLAKNQMEFGMLPSEQVFAMLLYQNGGEYYNADGSASALDSEDAVNSFKQYCEYYTDYKLDKETSVDQRFRTGECPIIIADYTLYNNLQVSAPDIDGLWGIAPVPGTAKENGEISRSVGSTGLTSLIMSATQEPEACWEFLKWWTSTDVQTTFGYEMESLQGKAGRVPTANLAAFENLAWKASDMEALLEQYSFVRGIPQVPGGYYSWRNVNNAFYTVTTDTDTASPREELMDKVVLINEELNYKWDEFELTGMAKGGE